MGECWAWFSAKAAVGDSAERAVVAEAVSRRDGFAFVLLEINPEGTAADLAVVVHV